MQGGTTATCLQRESMMGAGGGQRQKASGGALPPRAPVRKRCSNQARLLCVCAVAEVA